MASHRARQIQAKMAVYTGLVTGTSDKFDEFSQLLNDEVEEGEALFHVDYKADDFECDTADLYNDAPFHGF